MIRAVLDPNVIISALLSRQGSPAAVLRGWLGGRFETIVSPLLLGELKRALTYPKLRQRIDSSEAAAVLKWLADTATVVADPEDAPPVRSTDPDDDYLITLASTTGAVLVSGDEHQLVLRGEIPVFKPADLLLLLRDELGE